MTDDERNLRSACDRLVESAAAVMQKLGAPLPMILDRLLTYAAAQACTVDGSARTAQSFRELADKIDAGAFYAITGEDKQRLGARH